MNLLNRLSLILPFLIRVSAQDIKLQVGYQPCVFCVPLQTEGQWTQWSQWTLCEDTYGFSSQSRTRQCTYGTHCQTGDAQEARPCLDIGTPAHDDPIRQPSEWTQWSQWTTCSGRFVLQNQVYSENPLGIENYALHFKSPLRFGVGEEMTNTEVGVLGLAPPNANNLNDSVLGTGLDQGLFRLPIFTIHLKKCKTKNGSCEDGGSLTIGDFDPLNCHRVLIWIPLATYNSPEWKIHLDGFQINGKYTMNPTEALVDSGTSTLVVDRVVLDQIVKTIGAMKRYDKYIVPCNTHFTFSIVIENQVFDIMSSDLLLEIGRNYCQLAIDEGAYGLWLLGDPLYLRFCVAHNFQDRTVGLAPAIL
ncbi:hypothetical protein M3Y98_01111300 [Aphelenchoides besseyi]|nr:hypothetical protein M3Y98_01111300 [Aphelenchoides besseyi]